MKNKHAKQMIESISKPTDLYGCTMLDLPWIPHPFSYMHFDASYGRDAKVLKRVKRIASDEALDEINYLFDEVDSAIRFDITFNHGGEHQDGHYVNQYDGGGINGDSYAGQIWVPITSKRYFTFHYSC